MKPGYPGEQQGFGVPGSPGAKNVQGPTYGPWRQVLSLLSALSPHSSKSEKVSQNSCKFAVPLPSLVGPRPRRFTPSPRAADQSSRRSERRGWAGSTDPVPRRRRRLGPYSRKLPNAQPPRPPTTAQRRGAELPRTHRPGLEAEERSDAGRRGAGAREVR